MENAEAFRGELPGDVIGVPAAVPLDLAAPAAVLHNYPSYRVELGVNDRPQVGMGQDGKHACAGDAVYLFQNGDRLGDGCDLML